MSSRRREPRSVSIPNDLWDQVKREAAATGQPLSSVVVNALSTHFRSQVVRNASWDTDDSDAWYDETRFYTFSQDKFGHSATIQVTIPKMVAGEIAGLVDSGKIPELRTAQDFYRNAVRHQAYRTGQMLQVGSLIDASHQMTILDRVASRQAEMTEYEELETRISDLLDEELLKGHLSFVEEELKAYWDGASSVNERFRQRYLDLLTTFQDRLREAKAHQKFPLSNTKEGTVTLPDGRRFKNGIELEPEKRSPNRSST